MDKEAEKTYFIRQLELYSNSIIGFIVFQGLVYCYTFGSDTVFSIAVKETITLSVGLVIALSITMVLSFYATYLIGKRKASMVHEEHVDLVRKIYRGKLVVIVVFGLLPVLVTLFFGIIEGLLSV